MNRIVAFLACLVLALLPACTVNPFIRSGETVVFLGGSIFTKTAGESGYYEGPLGKLGYANATKDETVFPKAVVSSRTTLGLAGYAKDAFGMGEKTKVALGAQDVTKHGVSTAADVEKLKILNPVEEVAPAASVFNPATGLQSP